MFGAEIGDLITSASITFLSNENKHMIAESLKTCPKRMFESAFIN